MVRDYGAADLKEVERHLFEPSHSVSAWFAPDVKLGCLAGSMECPQCFGAEIYAQVDGPAAAAGGPAAKQGFPSPLLAEPSLGAGLQTVLQQWKFR